MSGKIRIIGGQWRGRKLAVPDREGLRPTGDRARETLFNWLQATLPGASVLDLFAGTGALGLEALSRGASKAVFVEQDPRLADALHELAASWPGGERMSVVSDEALAWLKRDEQAFDVVFIDPPFSARLAEAALAALVQSGRLKPGARVYVEQDAREEALLPDAGFELVRQKTLGEVRLTLLGFR